MDFHVLADVLKISAGGGVSEGSPPAVPTQYFKFHDSFFACECECSYNM